jgi:hypothetical protein
MIELTRAQYREARQRVRQRTWRRPAVPAWCLAGGGFLLAFVVVTWPLAARFTHATYGGPGDGWALIWQTRFRLDHGAGYFSPTYSTDIAWPVGAHYPSAILLSNAVLELPTFVLLLLGVGDVTAYNIIDLAGGVLSSLAMYALLRRLDCRPSIAFWGGLAYLLAPWHLEKLGIHPTLAATACFPLLLLGIVEWARSYTIRAALIVIGAFALATYTHGYYGLASVLVLLAAAPLVLARAYLVGVFRQAVTRTAALAAALLVVPLPLVLVVALHSGQVSTQFNRPVYLIDLAARPYLWLLPHMDNPVFGSLSRDYIEAHALQPNRGELALYLGVVTLGLALAGLIAAARRQTSRLAAALAAVTALVGVAFSVPGVVHVPGFGDVRMPISYLNDIVGFVSTPARFFVLTLTGVVVLAALGLERLAENVPGRWAVLLVGAACVGSAVELPFHRDGMVVNTNPPPVVHAIERIVPSGAPLAQYPSLSESFLPTAYQLFYQLDHHHPLLNGAPDASTEDGVRDAVQDPADPATPSKLALLGFHWATYDSGQAVFAGAAPGSTISPPAGLRIVRRLADGSVIMRVVARPAATIAGLGSAFSRTDRWMTSKHATIAACATWAGVHIFRFTASQFGGPRTLRIGHSPAFTVTSGPEEVRVPVPLRVGWQELRVELLGSEPTRPSDVIPGYRDDRTLVVQIGRITVTGRRGPPGPCQHGPIPPS